MWKIPISMTTEYVITLKQKYCMYTTDVILKILKQHEMKTISCCLFFLTVHRSIVRILSYYRYFVTSFVHSISHFAYRLFILFLYFHRVFSIQYRHVEPVIRKPIRRFQNHNAVIIKRTRTVDGLAQRAPRTSWCEQIFCLFRESRYGPTWKRRNS